MAAERGENFVDLVRCGLARNHSLPPRCSAVHSSFAAVNGI